MCIRDRYWALHFTHELAPPHAVGACLAWFQGFTDEESRGLRRPDGALLPEGWWCAECRVSPVTAAPVSHSLVLPQLDSGVSPSEQERGPWGSDGVVAFHGWSDGPPAVVRTLARLPFAFGWWRGLP